MNKRKYVTTVEQKQHKKLKNKNGITLIALVISIIVMLILAGVSLNAIIGENGIMAQAKNATYMQGIATLEEYLQSEYVKYYDEAEDYPSKIDLLINKNTSLCFKNGTKSYTIYDGKMYYLINKQALPEEIRNQLRGGDSTELSKYARLIDVYGVTPDLRVYYCSDGIDTALGNIDATLIDPDTPLTKIKSNATFNEALKEMLTDNGVEIGENGITYGNVSSLKELTIDGSKYPNISTLYGISELTSVKKLILKDLTLSDLGGIESCTLLSYVKFVNCTIGNYSGLANSLDLEYLYLYNPPSNLEIENLSRGLSNSNLAKLSYFGIFGYEPEQYTYGSPDSILTNTKAQYSNITDISSLANISSITKNAIKYMYLNNNKINSIESLSGFENISLIYLLCNPNLISLNGLENHASLKYVYAHSCKLADLTGLSGSSLIEVLTVQNNNLTSLNGIEDLNNLNLLYAYSNNLIDISALNNKDKMNKLSLKDNINIEDVKSLSTLNKIQYLYLENNINMNVEDVKNLETIISQCLEYSIPDKYLKYFSKVTKYDYTDSGLNDYSEEILALKNRTNVTYLRLYGNKELGKSRLGSLIKQGNLSVSELDKINSNLTLSKAEQEIIKAWKNYTDTAIKNMSDSEISSKESENDIYIRYILSTMTGLDKLSIAGMKNVTSLDFINKVTGLVQLDLRDTELTDLSILETKALSLDTLTISNTNVDMKKIQSTISRLGNKNLVELNIITNSNLNRRYAGGIILVGNGFNNIFKGCNKITKIESFEEGVSGVKYQSIDLTDCKSLEKAVLNNTSAKWILPSNLLSLDVKGSSSFDASNCTKVKTFSANHTRNTDDEVGTLSNSPLETIDWWRVSISMQGFEKLTGSFNTLKKIIIRSDDYGYNTGYKIQSGDCNSLKNFKVLEYLQINYYGYKDIVKGISNLTSLKSINLSSNNISDLSEFKNLENLRELRLHNNSISDISALSNLKNLSVLYLYNNAISNLKPLENLIENSKTKLLELYLNGNTLENTVLQNLNGSVVLINNIEILKKLNNAGLTTLNISGNIFQDTSELKKLQWASYNG